MEITKEQRSQRDEDETGREAGTNRRDNQVQSQRPMIEIHQINVSYRSHRYHRDTPYIKLLTCTQHSSTTHTRKRRTAAFNIHPNPSRAKRRYKTEKHQSENTRLIEIDSAARVTPKRKHRQEIKAYHIGVNIPLTSSILGLPSG